MNALLSSFQQSFHSEPQVIVRAPGRVNLIGEHVDYNDGLVLPVAIDREVRIAASVCSSQLASITSIDFDQAATFRISELAPNSSDGWIAFPTPRAPDMAGADAPDWAAYPAGVAWSLRDAGYALNGIDAVFTSMVPIGAGLSSSAAVEVAFAKTWQHLGDLDLAPAKLATLCQRAENEYVGVQCGIMDQMISALGRAGHALLLDCRDLSSQHVPLPEGYAIVICNTRVERSLAASAYNERRAQCEEAVRILSRYDASIHALRDVTPEFLMQHADDLSNVVLKRAQHVVGEIARVRYAVQALQDGRIDRLGQAMRASHESLRDLYEVSSPELDAMVDAAHDLDVMQVVGARLTGAGFGGCAVSIVREDAVERFLNEVPARYTDATGIEPEIYVCAAADGASVISAS